MVLLEMESGREKNIIGYHLYEESKTKKIQVNLFTKHKQTHKHRKQTYGDSREKRRKNKLGVWD